jgi:proline racemase
MYGAILTTPSNPLEADLDVIFINTQGYSNMCGHGILAIAKVVFETGVLGKEKHDTQVVRMSTPSGMVYCRAIFDKGTGEVRRTSFRNVPSFVYLQDQTVVVPGVGKVIFDISFGGLFFAIVSVGMLPVSQQLGITSVNYGAFISLGRKIRAAILQDSNIEIEHPFESDLSGLFGVIFTSPPHDPNNHSRNVNIFEDGEVDRSATGTGVSARSALHFARGELSVGEKFTVESIIGSTLTGKVVEEVSFGNFKAVVPEVSGVAHIMSQSELVYDPFDPFRNGFLLH